MRDARWGGGQRGCMQNKRGYIVCTAAFNMAWRCRSKVIKVGGLVPWIVRSLKLRDVGDQLPKLFRTERKEACMKTEREREREREKRREKTTKHTRSNYHHTEVQEEFVFVSSIYRNFQEDKVTLSLKVFFTYLSKCAKIYTIDNFVKQWNGMLILQIFNSLLKENTYHLEEIIKKFMWE